MLRDLFRPFTSLLFSPQASEPRLLSSCCHILGKGVHVVSPRQGSSFLLIPQISLHLMVILLDTHNVALPVLILVSRNREDSLAPGADHGPRILD